MEHRYGQRIPLNMEVMIQNRPGLRSAGCVVNASISGALVATAAQLPLHGFVQVQYTTHDHGVTSVHHVDSFVVRRARGQLALIWAQVGEPEVVAMLENGRKSSDTCQNPVSPALTGSMDSLSH